MLLPGPTLSADTLPEKKKVILNTLSEPFTKFHA